MSHRVHDQRRDWRQAFFLLGLLVLTAILGWRRVGVNLGVWVLVLAGVAAGVAQQALP